jgi:hypothetical protein
MSGLVRSANSWRMIKEIREGMIIRYSAEFVIVSTGRRRLFLGFALTVTGGL